jgi:hypothetical protein
MAAVITVAVDVDVEDPGVGPARFSTVVGIVNLSSPKTENPCR